MKKLLSAVAGVAFVGFASYMLPRPELAQAPGGSPPTAVGRGLVVAIDSENGILTISHEPLRELNMMAMTMGFPVKDRSQLAGLKPMQRIEFRLVFDSGRYLITNIK